MSDETETQTMTETPAPRSHIPESKWRIPMDTVKRVTAELPEEQRDALCWIAQYGTQSNVSIGDLAGRLQKGNGESYSHASLYAALTGRRSDQAVSLDRLCESILAFRRRLDETNAKMSTAFIETPMSRRIFAMCRRAFQRQRMTFIFGPSQVGKTATAAEYSRLYNHGETIFIRMPTGGSLTALMNDLAVRFNIPSNSRYDDLTRRLFDCFDERTLLIVDEAHQGLMGKTFTRGVRTLEWIRELYDRRHCGVVLLGTDVFLGHLKTHPVLQQLWKRRSPGSIVRLPAVTPPSDLVAFAAAFGLGPAPDRTIKVGFTGVHPDTGEEHTKTTELNPFSIQTEIVREQGLGSWIKLLEDAREDAKERGKALTWSGVLYTYSLAQAAERF